jgi:hypothetical protein
VTGPARDLTRESTDVGAEASFTPLGRTRNEVQPSRVRSPSVALLVLPSIAPLNPFNRFGDGPRTILAAMFWFLRWTMGNAVCRLTAGRRGPRLRGTGDS